MGEGRTDKQSDSLRQDLDRVTIAEAAERLGLSQDAIRKRVRRGTLRQDRDQDGLIHVYIQAGEGVQDTSKTEQDADQNTQDAVPDIVEQMRSRIESLERQLEEANTRDRENRRIIAGLVQRIPELEAPPATPQEAERVAESAVGVSDRGEDAEQEATTSQPTERRSWWRRLFDR